jgi:hypothetical protein
MQQSPHDKCQDCAETHNEDNEQQGAPACAQSIAAEEDPVRPALNYMLLWLLLWLLSGLLL